MRDWVVDVQVLIIYEMKKGMFENQVIVILRKKRTLSRKRHCIQYQRLDGANDTRQHIDNQNRRVAAGYPVPTETFAHSLISLTSPSGARQQYKKRWK